MNQIYFEIFLQFLQINDSVKIIRILMDMRLDLIPEYISHAVGSVMIEIETIKSIYLKRYNALRQKQMALTL